MSQRERLICVIGIARKALIRKSASSTIGLLSCIMAAMKLVDSTLPDPAKNLACDEALLDLCEAGFDHDLLRFWEPREHFVVLGYSSRIRADVELPRCARLRVPIFRRCSGGGTVLQGPGCLNFSLVLRLDAATRPAGLQEAELLTTISGTTRLVMNTHRVALERGSKGLDEADAERARPDARQLIGQVPHRLLHSRLPVVYGGRTSR